MDSRDNVQLKSSSTRVRDFLLSQNARADIITLPSACRTSQQAADALGCSVAQIAKSVIFRNADTDTPVLIVASGVNRVDVDKVQSALGITLGKANASFVKRTVGFVIGGVAPIAHAGPVQTLLDPDLQQYTSIWAAAGTPETVFELTPAELARLTGGQWLDVAERH